MPKHSKVNACLTLMLAVLFYLFFQLCKHQPALAQVNAFATDPYDAVGSFATQFAVFTALLSVVRAFRPYQLGSALDGQQVLLARGAYMTCVSVALTLGADIIALLRSPSVWLGFSAGSVLAVLVIGIALVTGLVGWRIHHSVSVCRLPSAHQGWVRATGISLVDAIILAWYPEKLTQSLLGELLTVIVAVTLLFAAVWAWAMVLSPSSETESEDFIDDLASIYRWLKAHTGHFSVLLTSLEKVLDSSFLCPIVSWLNPRKHSWSGILLFGMSLGVVLALTEAMSEGGLGPRFAVVAAVFASLEGVGVLVGYAFLAKPLGLFRHDFDDKVSQRAS